MAAPVWQDAQLWLHGDLHPANVVVRDGMFAGLIDAGHAPTGTERR
ncbi:phosphotransferase [Nocardia sp. CA-084685]